MRANVRTIAGLLLALGAGGVVACGPPPQKVADRSRDKRGASPQETVLLVKDALERRRYRDVLLHVHPEDQALFALGRLQHMIAFTEALETHDAERRKILETGLAKLREKHAVDPEAFNLGHESALAKTDLGSLMDGLGALGATTSVDGLGGFADLIPVLRDITMEGDTAVALAGDFEEPERWVWRRTASGVGSAVGVEELHVRERKRRT